MRIAFRSKRFLFLILGASLCIGCLLNAPARADNISFGQDIQPLNCLLTKVNAGTDNEYLMTPQDCSIAFPPPHDESEQNMEINSTPISRVDTNPAALPRIEGLKSLSGLSMCGRVWCPSYIKK